jgi:phosphoribosylaminoimidazolecarboxamide formyltransferase/IMP cyclohydrolase
LRIAYPLATSLRYGENPHQRAALYNDRSGSGVAGAEQLQGKELSYNNLVDLDACWELVREFDQAMVAIIKHTNPCGAAIGDSVVAAYKKALASDPVSAFGGVIGVNREVDGEAAEEIAKLFVEAVAAPSYSPEALARFAAKKNLRLIAVKPAPKTTAPERVIKQVSGGLLLQDADHAVISAGDLKLVTTRKPTDAEMESLLFAWRVCKHVKSNAIVYARRGRTVAVGAGQMSRVDSVNIAAIKAHVPLEGSVVASDAFFPFPDGLEQAVKHGATAFIQPGGSVKDLEVIAAADRLGAAMVFTGVRHFRH